MGNESEMAFTNLLPTLQSRLTEMGETTKSALPYPCPDLRGGFRPRFSDLQEEDRRTLPAPTKLRSVPRSIGRAVRSDVLAHASVRASREEVAALRRSPGDVSHDDPGRRNRPGPT